MEEDDPLFKAAEDDVAAVLGHSRADIGVQQLAHLGPDLAAGVPVLFPSGIFAASPALSALLSSL